MSVYFPSLSRCPLCLQPAWIITRTEYEGNPILTRYECHNGCVEFWIDPIREAMLSPNAPHNRNAVIPGLRSKLATMERERGQYPVVRGGPDLGIGLFYKGTLMANFCVPPSVVG